MTRTSWIRFITLFLVLVYVYRYSPYKIDYLGYYDSKIGAHMCNSIQKSKSASIFFKNIELDLYYIEETNSFDIFHPPQEVSSDLNLKTYISNINTKCKPFLWFDIKNLTKNNSKAIYNKISRILNYYNYPTNKILIESRYPEGLPIFSQNNYKTSYYITDNFWELNKIEVQKNILKIKQIVKNQPNLAISFNVENYPTIQKHFPDSKKYVWSLHRFINTHLFETRKILADNNIKIMLINYKVMNFN